MPANSRVYLWKPDNDGKLTLWTTVREWLIQMLQTQQLYLIKLVQLIFFFKYNVILRYFGTLVAYLNSYTQNEGKKGGGMVPMIQRFEQSRAFTFTACAYLVEGGRRAGPGGGGADNSDLSISIFRYCKVIKIHRSCTYRLSQQPPTLSAVNNFF